MKIFLFILLLTLCSAANSQLHYETKDSCFNALDSLNKKTGLWMESYSSTSYAINCYTNGLLNGTCYEYAFNILSEKTNYVLGIKNGVYISFNIDGFPLEISNYKNGKLSGIRYYFYENHSIRTIIYFENDLYNGIFEAYNPNGTISVRQEYTNGELNGHQILFWPNGNIKTISNYLNGNLQGEIKHFEENGNLIK